MSGWRKCKIVYLLLINYLHVFIKSATTHKFKNAPDHHDITEILLKVALNTNLFLRTVKLLCIYYLVEAYKNTITLIAQVVVNPTTMRSWPKCPPKKKECITLAIGENVS
jgi:hypothetical protein